MATVAKQTAEVFGHNSAVHVAVWDLTVADPVGDAIALSGSADRTIQFGGTFGASVIVILQGSNHEAPAAGTDDDWVTLTDPQGNAISKTSAALESVLELVRWVRPKIASGGDGSTAISARLLMRRG